MRVRSQLRRQRHRNAFNEYMEELRSRYESEVSIHEDRARGSVCRTVVVRYANFV